MISTKLPAVLSPKPPNSSISTERALNQIKELLLEFDTSSVNQLDKINASLDDIEIMLSCIDRG